MLDLTQFFSGIDNYVILRLSDDFPDCAEGSDIDILCEDKEQALNHILKVGKTYKEQGFQIKVSRADNHIHIDFYSPSADKLSLRFDLIENIAYKTFLIDFRFSGVVLGDRHTVLRKDVTVCVPSLENDLAVRFFEYYEYYQSGRPEKIKHYKYVEKHYCSKFIDVINTYSDLKVVVRNEDKHRVLEVFKGKDKFYKFSQKSQIRDLSVIYENYFGRRTDGCFVEIGAYDGDYVSSTSVLADMGWTGYYVEPIPEYSDQCKTRHANNKNVTVSQIAIGPESGTAKIHVGGPLSTIKDDMQRLFEFRTLKGNDVYEPIEVEQIPLGDYLAEHQVRPNFELLVVDVEGYEWEVFRNFDIEKWRPQVIIVELLDQNDRYAFLREDCENVISYFKEHDYRLIYKDFTNTIYVSNVNPTVTSRLDYFLIWGHGVQYTEEILDIIRKHTDLDILFIKRKSIDNLNEFIERVYSCDAVPLRHLIDKSRYLLDTEPEVIFILVKNNNVQERLFGRGPFRHIQCNLIKDIKKQIRERFDPKGTEHHVVHASDYESQTRHLLEVLNFPPPEHFFCQPNSEFDVPYHVKPFDNYIVKDVSINQLYVNILGQGILPIRETPHYKYLTGDKQAYRDYYRENLGKKLTDDHSPAAFDLMIANLQYDYREKRWPCVNGKRSFIIAQGVNKYTYELVDGIHRAAILRHEGVEILPILIPVAKSVVCLIYSKDRAMQLEAVIESFFANCINCVDVQVLYKTSNSSHQRQYDQLRERFRNVKFHKEYDFRGQTISILNSYQYFLLVVDDTLFVNKFSLCDVLQCLKDNRNVIGFSLRLGRNINYCYPKSTSQVAPVFETLDIAGFQLEQEILGYDWTRAEYDFGYPFEISSSVYAIQTLMPLLKKVDFHNPNTLEGVLANSANRFGQCKKQLLCYGQSVAFCVPVNLVQDVTANRIGGDNKQSAENLAKLYDEGYRIDVESYFGTIVTACEQEMEYTYKKNDCTRKTAISSRH